MSVVCIILALIAGGFAEIARRESARRRSLETEVATYRLHESERLAELLAQQTTDDIGHYERS